MTRRRMFRRHENHDAEPAQDGSAAADETFIRLRTDDLSRVFAVPSWLRDLGLMAWLLVGVLLLLAAWSGCSR